MKEIVGEEISIEVKGAVGFSLVVSQLFHCSIERKTDKSVLLKGADRGARNYGKTIWLPKKALVKTGKKTYRLAKWFQPNRYQERVLEESYISGVSSS